MIDASDVSVDRAEIGPARVPADDRLDVVIAIAGDEGADDGELVGEGRQLGERATEVIVELRRIDREGDAGDARIEPQALGLAEEIAPEMKPFER